MADIKDMSREEIEQYLVNMPKDSTEPSAKQKTIAAEIMRGADGNYDLNKIGLSKMFVDKANEHSYTDSTTGKKKSYKKGSKWQSKMDELPTNVRNYIYQRLNDYKSKGRMINKWDLREIEHSAKAKFGLPKSFDISSNAMLDNTMAKILNSINIQDNTEQTHTEQTPTEQTPTEQMPAEHKNKATNDELNASYKRIKNKKASDKDLALFNKYSEEQLKKMGFGPISINAIKNTLSTTKNSNTLDYHKLDDDAFAKLYEKNALSNSYEARKFMMDPSTSRRYREIIRSRRLHSKSSSNKSSSNKSSSNKSPVGKTPQQIMLDRYHEHH